jgi:hypothetical protein
MISLRIVDTDAFMDMPLSSQALYLHLLIRADDDGFIANPKKVMRMIGSQDDDLKILTAKKFVIPFESGVCVIKHWKIHNLIRSDRYTETQWIREKDQLVIDEKTQKYSLNKGQKNVIPNGNQMATQVRLGKVRKGKRENTPAEISKNFFEGGKYYHEYLELFSKDNNRDFIEKEFQKFMLYWTEPNKSGTKVRWEQQNTFDVKRRLFTWLDRTKNFQTTKSNKVAFS